MSPLMAKKIVSISPFGKKYVCSSKENDRQAIDKFLARNKGKKIIAVQGLGFVGFAMMTAIAQAKGKSGKPLYAVIGLDLLDEKSYWKIAMINKGEVPIRSSDRHLERVFKNMQKSGNIMATHDLYAYQKAGVVVVSVNLDVKKGRDIAKGDVDIRLDDYKSALRTVAENIMPSCLVMVESTVPPGVCEKVLVPIFIKTFKKRKIDPSHLRFAYSYERVMPGKNYLKSITSYYRVFAGKDERSSQAARRFLESIVDVRSYPLTELSSLRAAEMGKVLENSYRAANIAFIQEWTEYAEAAGVDLFEVLNAIRRRQTHNNIMSPGFGVGGYCLTKDPLFADWSNKKMFGQRRGLGVSVGAVVINDAMPLHSFRLVGSMLKGVRNKKIVIFGVSYLKDVSDTRYSPSKLFFDSCVKQGAKVVVHDPMVLYWPESRIYPVNDLADVMKSKADAVVFAVGHLEYKSMAPADIKKALKPGGLVFDAADVLDNKKADKLRSMGLNVAGVGKGHWNRMVKHV